MYISTEYSLRVFETLLRNCCGTFVQNEKALSSEITHLICTMRTNSIYTLRFKVRCVRSICGYTHNAVKIITLF